MSLVRGKNAQLLAVFRHSAAGHLDALLVESLHQELVGEGFFRVSRRHELLNRFTNTGVRDLRAVPRTVIASGSRRIMPISIQRVRVWLEAGVTCSRAIVGSSLSSYAKGKGRGGPAI